MLPGWNRLRPEQAKGGAGNEFALQVERVVDRGVHADKALGDLDRSRAVLRYPVDARRILDTMNAIEP